MKTPDCLSFDLGKPKSMGKIVFSFYMWIDCGWESNFQLEDSKIRYCEFTQKEDKCHLCLNTILAQDF